MLSWTHFLPEIITLWIVAGFSGFLFRTFCINIGAPPKISKEHLHHFLSDFPWMSDSGTLIRIKILSALRFLQVLQFLYIRNTGTIQDIFQ